MTNLTHAHRELVRRTADETFPSVAALFERCRKDKEAARDLWHAPGALDPRPDGERLVIAAGDDGAFSLNDWSFTQLCGLSRVSKETMNRLSPETAAKALRETLPTGRKPLQLFAEGERLRSVHGVSYTRLFNADLVSMLMEFATDFGPPPVGSGGRTGLYAGEQDMFCFLIDPTGWAEINGEAFAPGFFVWNSEVGKRSVGVSTFWFQAVCQNHIVWDATEVVEFTRKHTGKVGEALSDIRRIILALTERRDERRDGFVSVVKKAMATSLGSDSEEALKVLQTHGIARTLAKRAVEVAAMQGRLTVFSVVDALTRLAGEMKNAGDRVEADERAGSLLSLVTERDAGHRLALVV